MHCTLGNMKAASVSYAYERIHKLPMKTHDAWRHIRKAVILIAYLVSSKTVSPTVLI